MRGIITALSLLIVYSVQGQQTESKARNTTVNTSASPAVRTASRVLRGVTEEDFSSFKEIP